MHRLVTLFVIVTVATALPDGIYMESFFQYGIYFNPLTDPHTKTLKISLPRYFDQAVVSSSDTVVYS